MKRKNLSMLKALPMIFVMLGLLLSGPAMAQRKKGKKAEPPKSEIKSSTVSGLKFRNIGPAFMSGRISDFAVNPDNHSEYYVAVSSGHVWKTTNNGTTFKPIFDRQKSYAIGVVTMDPNNSNVVWVGTGENNHQRVIGQRVIG